MKLVLTILFVLWLFSFIKFKRAYKEYKLLVIFYKLRYENNTSQFFNDKLDALRHYGNALILAQQYSKDMVVAKVNIDEEALLADSQQIEVIPTLILYRGEKPLGFIVAPESKAQIDAFIQESLAQ